MNIGIFDSGHGGVMIANYFKSVFPEDDIVLVTDTDHLPYGSRSQQEIIELTDTAIQPLIGTCEIIVLACNTATAAAIDTLRGRYTGTKFVGVEPMIKPAATKSSAGVIAVFATPATLKSERYQKLKQKYAKDIRVIEPDCSGWAKMIEDNDINMRQIIKTVHHVRHQGADVMLLSCTHYHAIRQLVTEAAGGQVTVLEPSDALARRVRALKAN